MIKLDFDTMTKEDLLKANNQKVKLIVDEIDFYIFINIKPNNQRLLVHTNGAINIKKSQPPVFLRNSWRDDFMQIVCLLMIAQYMTVKSI